MTILAELTALYYRMPDLPRPGYSREAIGGEIVLALDGSVVEMNFFGTPDEKGKLRARHMDVPSAAKRSSSILPNLFWDKSAYALGVVAQSDDKGKLVSNASGEIIPSQAKRTSKEHAKFIQTHLELLEGTSCAALIALQKFLIHWDWTSFLGQGYPLTLLDQNLVFRLSGDRGYIHEIAEVAVLLKNEVGDDNICLVTAKSGKVSRLHPSIKGVVGAQGSGASLVSFNSPSYESHGKKQGDNAPISEEAVFAYSTALNALLARGSGQNLRMGDATVVFWVEAATPKATVAATSLFGSALAPSFEDENTALNILSNEFNAVARGRWSDVSEYDPQTRVFVLGLAPNAARLSVRFWHTEGIQDLALRIALFWNDFQIIPSPWVGGDGIERPPAAWQILNEIAALGEAKNIPPLLAGALMRSVLSGSDYPQTLLSGVISRLRVEGKPRDRNSDGRRASIILAVLKRNTKKEVPMALDETNNDPAYILGRLFGAFTYAERSLTDRNTTIRDKYMSGAAATPARIFPILMKGYEHNRAGLEKAGNPKVGAGIRAEKAVISIFSKLPNNGDLPACLPLEDQGRFFVGFYHQLSTFYQKVDDTVIDNVLEGASDK